jgi:ribosomal protein S18 acetylase RimI-like enzyme
MTPVHAFAPPVYAGGFLGVGGLGWIFPVQNVRVTTAGESDNIRAELANCADFFVDAFWTSKLQLRDNSSATKSSSSSSSVRQRDSLYQQQWAEFTKRYGNVRRNSELVILKQQKQKPQKTKKTADTTSYIGGDTDNDDEIILGIVGVEVDRVPLDPNNNNDNAATTTTTRTVPVMSNLAVAKSYRRRGLAERLVQSAEKIVRDSDWKYGGGSAGDDDNDDDRCCLYLYVEQQNVPAVRLYRKLGYTVVWKNARAESAVPTSTGSLRTTTTTVLCMKKQLIKPKRRFFFF